MHAGKVRNADASIVALFFAKQHLSHIDVHVPGEHTQDGRKYDAEIQMKHFYSATAEEAGVNNEMVRNKKATK